MTFEGGNGTSVPTFSVSALIPGLTAQAWASPMAVQQV